MQASVHDNSIWLIEIKSIIGSESDFKDLIASSRRIFNVNFVLIQ